jgi:hypothetical protein
VFIRAGFVGVADSKPREPGATPRLFVEFMTKLKPNWRFDCGEEWQMKKVWVGNDKTVSFKISARVRRSHA